MMRKPAILMLAGLLWSGAAQACSCAGTTSFADLVKRSELVVEGRVTRVAGHTYNHWDVAFQVTRTLKGKAPTRIHISDPMMCYTSIEPGEMEQGASYVIVLQPLDREVMSRQEKSTVPAFQTATCAETALLREGDKLYTFERAKTSPYAPQKKFYANYQDFIKTLPQAPGAQTKP